MNYFTSDTHFGSERALTLSRRPFSTVKEMDEAMVSNWNNIVGKNDTVYHLGDFGDITFTSKLNGHIILLMGNYEHKDFFLGDLRKQFYCTFSEKSFSVPFKDFQAVCVHEPENADFKDFTLFGHIHKAQQIKKNGLNVGVDCHNFTPISEEEVLFYKNAIDNFYDNNVFM